MMNDIPTLLNSKNKHENVKLTDLDNDLIYALPAPRGRWTLNSLATIVTLYTRDMGEKGWNVFLKNRLIATSEL